MGRSRKKKSTSTVLAEVLAGGSLKGLCHGDRVIYAIVCNARRNLPGLERALTRCAAGEGWKHHGPQAHAERLLLAHEMLFGRGLRRQGGGGGSAPSQRPL